MGNTPGTPNQFTELLNAPDVYPNALAPQPLELEQIRREVVNSSFLYTVNQQVWPDRAYMLARIRRADVYYRGLQYTLPYQTQHGLDNYTSNTGTQSLKTGTRSRSLLDYVVNIYRGDMRKFVSVLGQRSPNVKALPTVKGNPEQSERVRLADLAASYLHDLWKADEAHRDLVFKLAKSGPVYGYTPFSTYANTYGTTAVPQYGTTMVDGGVIAQCPHCQQIAFDSELDMGPDSQPYCPNPECGEPLPPTALMEQEPFEQEGIVSQDEYENGAPQLHLCTGLTVTTPLDVKRTDLSDCPWLRYEYWADKGSLIASYKEAQDPAVIKKIEGHISGFGVIGREEQRQAQEQTESKALTGSVGNRQQNRWLYTCLWLRPSMFYSLMLALGTDTSRALALIPALNAQFPHGVKLVMLNGYLIKAEPSDMSHEWCVCKSDASETIHSDAIFEDYIQAQDQVNDIFNLLIETVMRGLPITLFDPEVLDPDYIRNRGQDVNELIPAKPGTGSSFSNSFYKLDISRFEPELLGFMDRVIERYREIIGILPALFGGGGPEPTARAAEIKRNQALQQLNSVWNECRTFWERVYRNGALQQARYSPFRGYKPVTTHDTSQDNYVEFGDLSPLLQGGWTYSADESTPMTAGQRRDFIREVMGQSQPEVQQLLGLTHPDNVGELQEAFGLAGYMVPGVSERRHLSTVIYELAHSEPVMMPDPVTGMPVPEPSVPYDPFVFRPDRTVDSIQEWLHSDDAIPLKDTPGYQNVVLFGKKADAVLNPPLPPPGMDTGMDGGMGGAGGGALPPPEQATSSARPDDLVAPPPDGLAAMDPGLVAAGGPGVPGPTAAAMPPG